MTKNEIRGEAQKKKREAYGTSQIFRNRANFYRMGQRWLTFLGIAVPVLVGGVVLSFSNYTGLLPFLLPIVGIVSVTQLVLSVWALVNKWDDSYEYSVKSQDRNAELEFNWQTIAELPDGEIELHYESLRLANAQQAQEDDRQNVSQKERRRAMLATLFKYQTACAVCKKVPKSIKPSNCDCCGNF